MSKNSRLISNVNYKYEDMKMAECELFDGDEFITFNIVDLNLDNKQVTVAVTNRGKISVITYDLKQTLGLNEYYFEYGPNFLEVVFLSDFKRTQGVYSV